MSGPHNPNQPPIRMSETPRRPDGTIDTDGIQVASWDRLPPPSQPSNGHSTGRTTAGGSPRWLQITRDVLLSLFCLLASAALIFTAVALFQAGDTLSDIGNTDPASTSAPCFIPDDPTCAPPGD